MENQVVRRRVNTIASHIAAYEDISPTATHLLPMSCSNSLNSVIRRCDNRMNFARQASSSQGCFMRQTTNELGRCSQSTRPSKSTTCANMSLCTSEAPMFSRPTRIASSLQNVGAEAPMFSRPTGVESSLQHVGQIQSLLKGSNYPELVPEAPSFARPSRTDPKFQSKKRNFDSVPKGLEWSPKMDVAESGSAYVIAIELPGISVGSIRVAVSNQKLMVTGTRSIQWCKADSYCNNSISAYHKKEISQGPYKIVWPLPTNVDKDSISAEFVDGLLQITIPKLSAVTKPLKGYI